MATEIRRRRGSTADHSTFTGAPAELTVDTDKNTIVVHDGATVGGWPVPTNIETLRDVTFTSAMEEDGLVRISGVWTNTSNVTSGLTVPAGTEGERSTTGGFTIRFNTDAGAYEGYNGTAWVGLGAASADLVPYDNTESGLDAENVQDAIDELQEEKQNAAQVESAIATRNIATVRQTTERGPVDSNGRPDVLESAGGLQVQTKGISSSTPLVVVLTLSHDEDYRVILTDNLGPWALADNTDDQQLVIDLTPGEEPARIVTPIWSIGEVPPSSPSVGAVWFNTQHWHLPQEWDGSEWVEKYYSWPLGEVSTSSGSVTSIRNYAYRGIARVAFTTSGSGSQNIAINIGVPSRYISIPKFEGLYGADTYYQLGTHNSFAVGGASPSMRYQMTVGAGGRNIVLRKESASFQAVTTGGSTSATSWGDGQFTLIAKREF